MVKSSTTGDLNQTGLVASLGDFKINKDNQANFFLNYFLKF